MKLCNSCNSVKPFSDFSSRKGIASGLRSYCKDCSNKQSAIYAEKNRDSLIEKKRKRRLSDEAQEKSRAYYLSNKYRLNARQREYDAANKEKRNLRRKLLRRTNMRFMLTERARARITIAMRRKGYKKGTLTSKMLGCDWDHLCAHIEAKFTDGMSWENYGQWHVDHKIPLSSATTEDELIELCHYTNLQPLWAADNIRKGAKIMEAA